VPLFTQKVDPFPLKKFIATPQKIVDTAPLSGVLNVSARLNSFFNEEKFTLVIYPE
jgi:hypothetical protein